MLSGLLQTFLNDAAARSAASVGADVADVATAFTSADTTPVATNDTRYAVRAETVAGRLG
ncbi:MAG: hypothetical protein ABIP45_09440 [Knoellia sp.]